MDKKFLRTVFIGLLACPIFLSDSASSYAIEIGRSIYATAVVSAIPRSALNIIAREVSIRCKVPGDTKCTPSLYFIGTKKEIGSMQDACSHMQDLSSSATREKNLRVQCSAAGATKVGIGYYIGCRCDRLT